jgi:hypothetical protein
MALLHSLRFSFSSFVVLLLVASSITNVVVEGFVVVVLTKSISCHNTHQHHHNHHGQLQHSPRRVRHNAGHCQFLSNNNNNNKDDEIAQLEAKLRELKEQQQQQVSRVVDEEDKDSFIITTTTDNNKKVSVGVVTEPYVEMLTEQWKERDDSDDNGSSSLSPIITILGTIALTIVLGVFSQVPIGQEDLNKYSSIKSGTTTTPTTQNIDLGDLNSARKSSSSLD